MEPIHALSSGALPAGVAVVRLSGTGALDIARRLIAPQQLPPPRTALLRSISAANSGQLIDRALVIQFPAPHSFTGEDVVEIHCHGGIAVVRALLDALAEAGSRPAEAGEFTRRAFLNGRLDLIEADALGDLIAAETEVQRRYALSADRQRLAELASNWRQRIIACLARLEADLDFADEGDVADAGAMAIAAEAAALASELRSAAASAASAERIRAGLSIAILGPPNAGKSSLLNALAKRDVAIVTPHAGTTRDIIEVHLDLGGRAATIADTAGLRDTDDPIEAEGIARARARAAAADLRLDLGQNGNIVNKIDETGARPGHYDGKFHLSARTGAGLDVLEAYLVDWARTAVPAAEFPLVANARQQRILESAAAALTEASSESDAVLAAESLRRAVVAFDRLSGRVDAEEVLDEVFGRFCIGK